MKTAKEIKRQIRGIQAKDRTYNSVVNEGGEGYERNSVPAELINELAEAEKAEFAAEWTKEATAERRAKWNEIVKSRAAKGPVRGNDVKQMEKEAGFTMSDLKKAVELHGLQRGAK